MTGPSFRHPQHGPRRGAVPCAALALAIALASLFPASAGAASPSTVIMVQGSGGEEAYSHEFTDWARRLRAWLIAEGGIAGDRVLWLGQEASTDGSAFDGPATLDGIRAAMARSIAGLPPDAELMIFLIGHGAHVAGESRFMIPGPDLSAPALAEMLVNAGERPIILVNASASSAGFINALSGPGRIIVTATRSVNERNATRFMESFLQGLEDGSGDENRDGRISLLEAARQAERLTAAWFAGQGYLVTEHPLIDDNGDRLGTRLIPVDPGDPAATDSPGEGAALDGSAAARYFLRDFSFPPEVPEELVQNYIGLLDRIEGVKSEKSAMEPTQYRARLEPLLIDAARAHREIRRIVDRAKLEAGSAAPNP